MSDDDELLRDVVALFSANECPPGRCYRCWQVGHDAPATLGVFYNFGTEYEWRSASCEPCFDRDSKEFPTQTKIIMRLK